MRQVMIIGSNSFSGASFSRYLLDRDYEVIGVSRSVEPPGPLRPYSWSSKRGQFNFFQLNINTDLEAILDLTTDNAVDTVYNFSAQSMVAESWLNPDHWFQTNTLAAVKLHEGLRRVGTIRRYVHVTTPEVYGNCEGFVDESFPFNPSTPYAVSRAAADMSLKTFFDAYGFPVVSTRAANVYGPGQQLYRIIPRTILAILTGHKLQLHGGGLSTRSFIHIDDVSAATLLIAESGTVGDTYHISTNQVISIRKLVEIICQLMGAEFNQVVEIVGERLGKDSAYHLSSEKLRAQLGWTDQIALEAGLEGCVNWAMDNISLLKDLPRDYQHRP